MGRGSSGAGGASGNGFAGGGGGGTADIISTTSLVSQREGKQRETDQALSVLRDVEREYGVDVMDAQIATLGASSASVMAYYDSSGNLAINKNYFSAARMNDAYDDCVKNGFHPSRGNKTGIEAVTAHEMGHRLTDAAGVKQNRGNWAIDQTADSICRQAATNLGYKRAGDMAKKISGYAHQNAAECVAEAFSDVYCNGSKAKRESKAVVNVLNGILKN